MWVALLTLLRGGTLVMQQRFDPESFTDTLIAQRITRVAAVPTRSASASCRSAAPI